MEKNSEPEMGDAGHIKQRRLCLEHAGDLVASAQRVLADDNYYPNIAYHLAILAMEEIGKAGMLLARAITKGALDVNWIDKRLDDHVQKLMWAVWSPSMTGGKIDPKDFEEARRFAERTHERRMAGLYVDYRENTAAAPPREAVRIEHATSLVNLAKARLELEASRSASIPIKGDEELEWFLSAVADALASKRLFSGPFIRKHEEFGADTRAWVRWARDEFKKIEAEEKAHLQRELSRQASEPGKGKPKWLIRVRVQTPSHSLRQKTLNYWNDRIEAVKLRTAGTRGNDLMLEMTINDHVPVEQVFDFGLSFSKLHLVMLNIGTAGFFWYELSSQAQAYYESIQDLEAPQMKLSVGRISGLPKEWSEDRPDGSKHQRLALEEAHLNIAIMSLAAFGSMTEKDAEPIFGQYLKGLVLLSKTDLHLSVEKEARDAFLTVLRRAMSHFGDAPSEDTDLLVALHQAMQPIIADASHRDMLFKSLGGAASDGPIADAVSAKRATDLYLGLVARRLWPEFVGRVNGRPPPRDEE